jgi:hypothetical protein
MTSCTQIGRRPLCWLTDPEALQWRGDAAEQGDEADEAFGGTNPRAASGAQPEVPPNARAAADTRGHRIAAYPRCSTDVWEGEGATTANRHGPARTASDGDGPRPRLATSMTEIDRVAPTDRNGRAVNVGTRVRVLEIAPSLRSTLPANEWQELQEMLGQVFVVYEIDEWGKPWVEKWWYPTGEESFCHSLSLDSHEMEVVEADE